jgi:hypothetical protein
MKRTRQKHSARRAIAVGVVAADYDIALVIEQPVKDMQGFACRRRDHFRVEWGIAIGGDHRRNGR